MAKPKVVKQIPLPTRDQIEKHIEEAAYYIWLNRGHCAEVSNELNDWIAAEKEVMGDPRLVSIIV